MINSVSKALGLLEILDGCGKSGLGLVELAAASGLKAPTTHNLLVTLEEHGFVERDATTRRYALGRRAVMLGNEKSLSSRLSDIAMPYINSLHKMADETVILAIYQDMKRTTIIAIESGSMLRVSAQIGADENFVTSATGRVLMSMLPEVELDRLCAKLPSMEKLWPEVEAKGRLHCMNQLRIDGCVNLLPHPDVRALGVPVYLKDAVPASVGMFYPRARHTESETTEFIKEMKAAAKSIESLWNKTKETK